MASMGIRTHGQKQRKAIKYKGPIIESHVVLRAATTFRSICQAHNNTAESDAFTLSGFPEGEIIRSTA